MKFKLLLCSIVLLLSFSICGAQSHNLKPTSACKYVKKNKGASFEGLSGCEACVKEDRLERAARQALNAKKAAAAKAQADLERTNKAKQFAAAQEKKRLDNKRDEAARSVTISAKAPVSSAKSVSSTKTATPVKTSSIMIQSFYDYGKSLFGIKSEKGTVIFEPQFSQLDRVNSERCEYVGIKGNKVILIGKDGRILSESGPYKDKPKLAKFCEWNKFYLECDFKKTEICSITLFESDVLTIVDGKVTKSIKRLYSNGLDYVTKEFMKERLTKDINFTTQTACLEQLKALRNSLLAQGYYEGYITCQ